MTTGYVWLEQYVMYDTGTVSAYPHVQPLLHFEGSESKARLATLVEVSGLMKALCRLPATLAEENDLLRVHDPLYVRRIQATSELSRGGDAGDVGTQFTAGGYDAACLAVGGVIAAVRGVLDGTVGNAYALVRPPGHHAEVSTGRGFCIFANIPVAIQWARANYGVERVAVVDWDVHHGNGTQSIFYDDPDTLVVSLHQDGLYPPGSGSLLEQGIGSGLGTNLNIPLPAGSGNAAYLATMNRVVVPALEVFRPDIVLVASGFDAGLYDPLGRMLVTVDGFRAMTKILIAAADQLCDGRLVMSHEGGYSSVYVPLCGLAVLETMAGIRTGVDDPVGSRLNELPDQALKVEQDKVITAASALVPTIRHQCG